MASISFMLSHAQQNSIAHNVCPEETVYKEIVFPIERYYDKPFVYLNDEWIPGVSLNDLNILNDPEKIKTVSVKNDEYNNSAIFIYLEDQVFGQIKNKYRNFNLDSLSAIEPVCMFPGGNGRLQDWIRSNTMVPVSFDGYATVTVGFKVSPDGTVSDAKLLRSGTTNDDVIQEALRLVNSMPRFIVEFPTPKNHPFYFSVTIEFLTPGRIVIR